MTEQEDIGLAFRLEETEIGSREYKEKRTVWSNDLLSVIRFAEVPTIHKSNLFEHVANVNMLAQSMASYLAATDDNLLDGGKIYRLALHHDDAEVITGDIPSPVKAAFTQEEREAYRKREDEAMVELSQKYMPSKFQQLYLDDWKELTAKQSPEAQLIEIADKWDGLCETITDIRCGNDDPEIFQVLKNYQALFKKMESFPLMEKLEHSFHFGFKHIPTIEETTNFSKIDLNLLSEVDGKDAFWERVFDPSLPAIYKHWLSWSFTRGRHDLGKFPRWKDVLSLPEYQLSHEEKSNLFKRLNGFEAQN